MRVCCAIAAAMFAGAASTTADETMSGRERGQCIELILTCKRTQAMGAGNDRSARISAPRDDTRAPCGEAEAGTGTRLDAARDLRLSDPNHTVHQSQPCDPIRRAVDAVTIHSMHVIITPRVSLRRSWSTLSILLCVMRPRPYRRFHAFGRGSSKFRPGGLISFTLNVGYTRPQCAVARVDEHDEQCP